MRSRKSSKASIRNSWWFEDNPYRGPHGIYGVMAIRGSKGIGYTAMPGEVDVEPLKLITLEETLYDLQDYDMLGKDGYDLIKDYLFILVPCVAWNERGYRVGSGAGFYDRLLQYNENLVVIFVTLEKYKVDFLEEVHDIQADFIVTERKCYEIG